MSDEHALPPAEDGILAELTAPLRGAGTSAFRMLERADDALTWRLALIDSAVSSIDVKYFIWHDHPTGDLMLERLLAAAARGVRVRLLVDDLNLAGDDSEIASIDALADFSIRLFNAAPKRSLVDKAKNLVPQVVESELGEDVGQLLRGLGGLFGGSEEPAEDSQKEPPEAP